MSKAAKTPRSNCVLDTTKAKKAEIGMRPVEEAMRESMKKWLERSLYEKYSSHWWFDLSDPILSAFS